MSKELSTMHQRVNITLPEDTLRLIDRVATKGDRSRFIDIAVKHYVDAIGRANLRKQLKEGAVRHASRDLSLAQEWFPLEEEACRRKQS
jgi:CopG family transcriptional regulator/antitoxin EndoAI